MAAYSFKSEGIEFQQSSTGDRYLVPINWNDGEWTKDLAGRIEASGAVYEQSPQGSDSLKEAMTYVVAGIVLCVALYFVLRRIGGGTQQNIFALRNSKARVAEESSKVCFENVGGCFEAKQELSDLVNFLKSPQRWTDAGARLPRGVLLEGPPGCGKTLLPMLLMGANLVQLLFDKLS